MSTETPELINPTKTALLLMDYQNGVMGLIPDPEALLAKAADTIALIRSHGGTIGYVRVGFADGEVPAGGMGKRINAERLAMFHADAPSTQVHDAIAPQDGDIVVRKTRVGPFGTTDLHEQLQARGIDTLLLAGISTSGVTLSTVRDAHDKDYRVIVLSDLCADPEPDVHEFLVEKIFPRQGEVITAAELHGLLH
jgi:nicotinamidase-related amidase